MIECAAKQMFYFKRDIKRQCLDDVGRSARISGHHSTPGLERPPLYSSVLLSVSVGLYQLRATLLPDIPDKQDTSKLVYPLHKLSDVGKRVSARGRARQRVRERERERKK